MGALQSRLARLALLALLALLAAAPAAHAELRIRKDVKDMTVLEKRDFVAAVLKLKHTPSPFGKHGISLYDALVYYHRRAFGSEANGAHQGPAFLPWHREFLLAFENAMRNVTHKAITIPYWDWTDPASTRAAFGIDMMGGDGVPEDGYAVDDGAFRKGQWSLTVLDVAGAQNPLEPDIDVRPGHHWIQRAMGTLPIARTLPSRQDMNDILGVPRYDAPPYSIESNPMRSFRCAIEGWRGLHGAPRGGHNLVHLWVAGRVRVGHTDQLGTIGNATSPNDPIFWLVHANVDRMWTLWEKQNGQLYEPLSGAPYGHNLRDRLSQFRDLGFTLRPIDMLNPMRGGVVYQPPIGR
ncbi:MAG TPA: tyrosinase family protein [Solirubrobacteraceae bacterium]|jgi:tyrosinase